MKISGKWIALLSAAVIVVGTVGVTLAGASSGSRAAAQGAIRDTAHAAQYWTNKELVKNADKIDLSNTTVNGETAQLTDGVLHLKKDDVLRIPVDIAKEGAYQIFVEYRMSDPKVMDSQMFITLDDGAAITDDDTAEENEYLGFLPSLWTDATDTYSKDSYGSELIPEQVSVDYFVLDTIANYRETNKETLQLQLTAGNHSFTLKETVQELDIKNIYVAPVTELPSYSDYVAANGSKPQGTSPLVTLEGEKYALKSDSFIRGGTERNPGLTPYETYEKKINMLEAGSWKTVGQKVVWEFKVESAGWYRLGFHYTQYSDTNKSAYRTIEIDGQVPFEEFRYVDFPQTRSGQYKNYVPADSEGNALLVYLEAGEHTLGMTAVMGPQKKAYEDITAVMKRLNDLGMELKKLTAGVTDKNRTWDMDVYLPHMVPSLKECAEEIRAIYDYLESLGDKRPTYADELEYAAEILDKLVEKPRVLPNNTDKLNVGDSSVTKFLGNVLSKLISQPLGVDAIYVASDDSLPRESASFVAGFSDGVRSFVNSFLPNANNSSYAATYDKNSPELKVWINRPIQYVQVLQQIVDADYNDKYGTNIQLSIMPNEQKLILANASGTNPDVALSINFYTPFDFAVRGAAKNLLEYDDFLEFYAAQYNLESLAPMYFYNGTDGVYGAVETQDFQVLYYRKDILETLGLEVPNTWGDVKKMMPTLLRYSMNFNIPIANAIGFKSFSMTAPFIYQNGGNLYAENGLTAVINTEDSIKGFKEMTEMFSIYGVQQYIGSFYQDFRSGNVPLGISGFSTYMQLSNAAPELAGLWDIALSPGTELDNGDILRYQTADVTSCMIFENTTKSDQAWQFVKWWLSKDTQVKYAYMLQSTFGPEFRWNTANLEAFQELPYPEEHRKIIMAQWEEQKENVRHPANYMLEREVSNVWNNVVAEGKNLIESIDKATLNSDREIQRKLEEFGFVDKDGNITMEYRTDATYRLYQLLEEGRKNK